MARQAEQSARSSRSQQRAGWNRDVVFFQLKSYPVIGEKQDKWVFVVLRGKVSPSLLLHICITFTIDLTDFKCLHERELYLWKMSNYIRKNTIHVYSKDRIRLSRYSLELGKFWFKTLRGRGPYFDISIAGFGVSLVQMR